MILTNHQDIYENKFIQDVDFRQGGCPLSPSPLRPPCHHGIRNGIRDLFN